MPDRVDAGDAEQVVDQAARARAAGRAANAHLADQVGDVADGEEVRRVAEPPDQLQLVVEPLPDHRLGSRAVAVAERALAARPQQPVGLGSAGGHPRTDATGGELELREVHLAQPEVAPRVDRAPVGHRAGAGEQPPALAVGVGGQSGEPGDLFCDLGHLLAGLEEPLGVAAVDVAPVEGDQPAGGVEDVDGGGVAAVGVADRVAEHRAEPGLPGDPRHPGGVGGGAGTPPLAGAPGSRWETSSTWRWVRGTSARHGSRVARARSSRRPPEGQSAARASSEVGPSSTTRLPAASCSPSCSARTAKSTTGSPRSPERWVAETSRHSAAQPARPPHRPFTVEPSALARKVTRGSPPDDRVAVAAAADRGPGRRCAAGPHLGRVVGQLDAEHRSDARGVAGAGELHRAVGAVAVGQGEGVHLLLGGPLDQRLRMGGAVAQGVARGDVQMHERVGHDLGLPGGSADAAGAELGDRPADGR